MRSDTPEEQKAYQDLYGEKEDKKLTRPCYCRDDMICRICVKEAGVYRNPERCYCGDLHWTYEQWGRPLHKHECGRKLDACQSHPEGCP